MSISTPSKEPVQKIKDKQINNAVSGKTMENLQKRVDVKLITDEKQLSKLVSEPTYVSSKIFNENFVAVHKIKESLTLNKPAYVGMNVFDLSKNVNVRLSLQLYQKEVWQKSETTFYGHRFTLL